MITVYGQPDCYRCKATVDYLRRKDARFVYYDVSVDLRARDEVMLLQYQELPVVTVGDMHWSGFRPGKLDQAIELMSTHNYPDDAEATAYLMGS